jgi:hypothetical protein
MTPKLAKLRDELAWEQSDEIGNLKSGDPYSFCRGFTAASDILLPVVSALMKAIEEHVECDPGMYGNECVGLGGADELKEALAHARETLGVGE